MALTRYSTLPFLLRASSCLANVPITAAWHYGEAFGLAVAPLPLATPTFGQSLVWHVRDDADPHRLVQAAGRGLGHLVSQQPS